MTTTDKPETAEERRARVAASNRAFGRGCTILGGILLAAAAFLVYGLAIAATLDPEFSGLAGVTSSPGTISDAVVETVDFLVFPPGSSQYAYLVFHAEGIMSFEDMPSQTQAIAETLTLEIGEAA